MYVYVGTTTVISGICPWGRTVSYLVTCRTVEQGLVKLLCKGPDGKHLRLHGPVTDSVTCSSLFFNNLLKI